MDENGATPAQTPDAIARQSELRKINSEPGPWDADKEARANSLYPSAFKKPQKDSHPHVEIELGLSAGGSDEESRSRQSAAVSPEDAAADAAAASHLTPEELADAHEGANALTQRLGIAAAQDLIGAYLEGGGDRKAGYMALAKFGRVTRT